MYEEQRLTIPATGKHDWSDWWIVKKSTVFKTGTKKRECWICDKTQTVSIPKLKPFVKLNKKTISLTAGKSYRLKASYAKGDSVKKCKSSNKKVATVSKKGVISARQAGKVRITIYTKSVKRQPAKLLLLRKRKPLRKVPLIRAVLVVVLQKQTAVLFIGHQAVQFIIAHQIVRL